MAQELKDSGLNYYHHNLETAESHFDKICTTHTFQERVQTIKHARQAGLTVCSGGLFGMGETPVQRVELAMTLQNLDVTSVPINILHPVDGTPQSQQHEPIRPLDILKLIATFRFALPKADIGVFGGRELNLRDLQSWIFPAGANMILIGNYLTTSGRKPEDDLQMLDDLGLWVNHQGHHGSHAEGLAEIRSKMNGNGSAKPEDSSLAKPAGSSFVSLPVLSN
jgi:biotin synthase